MTYFVDYCTCSDCEIGCPEDCFRKQITTYVSELAKNRNESVVCSVSSFKGTTECPISEK